MSPSAYTYSVTVWQLVGLKKTKVFALPVGEKPHDPTVISFDFWVNTSVWRTEIDGHAAYPYVALYHTV